MNTDTLSIPTASQPAPFDVQTIKAAFPALQQSVHGQPLVYLDNAATTQKPQAVIDTIAHYYQHDNANVHRGVHELSMRATQAYEQARLTLKQFVNARSEKEIIFTRGTTESINLVAHCLARSLLKAGDEVIISHLEHHSNIVPWQLACEQTGATLKVIPINTQGELVFEAYQALLSPKTKVVAVGHISNAIGSIHPIKNIIAEAKKYDAITVIDGAQAAPHTTIDVQQLDCDFYAISAHKVYGPTGIGLLYGKEALLETLPPYQGGGEMIKMVSFDKTLYNDLPHKFEAGTPNIAGAIGFGATVDFIQTVGMDRIAEHEQQLLSYATEQASAIEGLNLIGTAEHKASILSFTLDFAHAHDVATIMDQQGVAIRAGHHCAMPAMKFFKVPATIRASLAMYNTFNDVDRLFAAIQQVREVFKP